MHLNLISEESRREIKLRHISEIMKRINFNVLILAILLAAIFYFSNIIFKNYYQRLTQQSNLIISDSLSGNSQAKEMSGRLDYIDGLQKEFTPWSFALEEISKITNQEIVFYSISFNKKDNLAILRGLAESRDSLIDLREELEASEMFTNINFPIKNILEQSDISFEIKANLNL